MAITQAPEPAKQPVPEYQPSLERLYQMVGMRDDRIAQLEAQCHTLAAEVNEWNDRFLAVLDRAEKAERSAKEAEREIDRARIRENLGLVRPRVHEDAPVEGC